MTLLEELMKQYKTTMEDLMIYTNLAEDKLMSFITGDISILDCPVKIFADLAKTFGLTVQELWDMAEHYDFDPKAFEIFKSNTCHAVKEMGNKEFINEIVNKEYIEDYWDNKNRLCACYLLAMIDYLCRLENLPLIEKFDCIRGYRLPKLIYPYSFNFANNPNMIKKALAQAITEFYKHGIVEGDVFNVY